MWMDEQLLNIINQQVQDEEAILYEATVKNGIQTGLLETENLTLHFIEQTLLNNQIRLQLPQEFTTMASEQAELKYPSPCRPNLILTDASTTVNFAFNHTLTPLKPAHIEEYKQTMMQAIVKMQSSAQFLEDGIKEINGLPVGFFEFISPALDGDIYNLAGFTPLKGRALLINFNCFETDMPIWRSIAFGILDSLELIDSHENATHRGGLIR